MQILDALRHAMRGAGSRAADLQHAAMHLHVEGEDVAAQIGEHPLFDQDVPEPACMFWPDLTLIGRLEAVDRMHRMMADHELVPRRTKLERPSCPGGPLRGSCSTSLKTFSLIAS